MARNEEFKIDHEHIDAASGVDKKIQKKKGFIYAIIASSVYAFNSILGKLVLVEGVEPLVLNFYQYLLGMLIILGVLLINNREKFKISKVQLKQTAVQGVFGAFGTSILFYLALNHLNAGIASMLLFTNPVFITLFFAITGIKKLRIVNYVALFLAMTGIVFVLDILSVKGTAFSLIGIGFGLASALTYTFYNLYADFKMVRMDHYTVLFYTTLFGFMASLVSVIGVYGVIPSISFSVLKHIALIAVSAGILPVVFFYKSIELIGSERTSIVATLELPMTLIVAFLVLKEHLNGLQVVGAVFVISAVLLLHRGD